MGRVRVGRAQVQPGTVLISLAFFPLFLSCVLAERATCPPPTPT
jgi:hypothetical protein